ncbi:MAG: FAD-dependent oxidoreductase [Bacteroidetes bacterium B1(2017)]|nr:MAG: FAD-dependent oxidoreductase [Bacteroidetes bacterium B1(2017)]
MVQTKKHIVIIGAGFAGLKLARTLNNHPSYRITLIDKNNYHQFQPLLYQVAMANLDASNISFPLRTIFNKSKNVSIRVETVLNINAEANTVQTNECQYRFDFLVLATGAATNYFGNKAIEENTLPMKSTWEALQIRNSLLKYFEDAVSSQTPLAQIPISIVIVGGGPTGVELSGALAEMKRDSLPLEYPELDFTKMKIYLLEGTNRLLINMSEMASKSAKVYLEEMGVIVKTNTFVKGYEHKKVLLQDDSYIHSTFVIWVAGVKGSFPPGLDPNLISKSNQLKTNSYNKVLGSDNIFAIGDISLIESTLFPRGFPQLASVAIDQAKNLAKNFKQLANNKKILPYQYLNKGNMATVGRNKAVVDLAYPTISFQGFFAWVLWMTLHLFLLIGFKNKLIVFINWTYHYFTNRQSLSLLFEQLTRKNKP